MLSAFLWAVVEDTREVAVLMMYRWEISNRALMSLNESTSIVVC
jgi:hypothetical protein